MHAKTNIYTYGISCKERPKIAVWFPKYHVRDGMR